MVFVVDKSLIIMIFMYSISFTVLAGQALIADAFHFTLISPVTNVPMKSTLLSIGNINNFQSIEQNATTAQRGTFYNLQNQVGYWGNLFFDIFLVLTGTQIFQVLVFFGIPGIFVLVILVPYYIFLFRTVLGYAKNFF